MNFKCKMCGACCRIKNGFVRVSDVEISRIAEYLKKSETEIIDSVTEIAPDRLGLVLKSRPDGSCIFLSEDNRCNINPVKPDKCGSFPFEWTNPDSEEICPAIKALPSFAVVGINGYAQTHLQYLKALVENGSARMCGIVILPLERTPENTRWFKNRHVPVFDSLDALYSQCIPDVVFLPVGIASHLPLTLFCLSHGSNVMVEKPLAGFSDAIREITEARDKAGKFVAVGFQHLYTKEVQKLKRLLLDGAIGKIASITASGISPRNDDYYNRNKWAGKIRTANGAAVLDSPINNAYAHYVNLALFLAGGSFEETASVDDVVAQLYRARRDIEYFDTCGVQCSTVEGTRICAYFAHATKEYRATHIEIAAEKGRVSFDPGWNGGWEMTGISGEIIAKESLSDPNSQFFPGILDRVSDDSIFICTPEIAGEHVRLIEKIAKFDVTDLATDKFTYANGIYDITALPVAFDKAVAEMSPLEI